MYTKILHSVHYKALYNLKLDKFVNLHRIGKKYLSLYLKHELITKR